MAQQQQFLQPQRRREELPEIEPQSAPTAMNSRSAGVSSNAQDTLGDIDDVLANNGRGAPASSSAGASPTVDASNRPAQEGGPTGAMGKPLGGGGALGKLEQNGDKGPGGAAGALGGKGGEGAEKAAEKLAGAVAPEVAAALKGAQLLQNALVGNAAAKRRTLIGGSIGGGVIVTLIAGLFVLLPNGAVSMMGDLENRGLAIAKQELNQEAKLLIQDHIRNRIIYGTKACGPTYNATKWKACYDALKGKQDPNADPSKTADQNPIEGAGGLDDELDRVDFAGMLRDKGISFDTVGGTPYIYSDSIVGGKIDITDFVSGKADLADVLSKTDPHFADLEDTTVKDIIQTLNGTNYGDLESNIVRKYNAKFCAQDCKPGDEQKDRSTPDMSPANRERFADALDADRTIPEAGQAIGQATNDLLNQNFDDGKPAGDTADAAHDSTVNSESKLTKSLDKARRILGIQKVSDLLKQYDELKKAKQDWAIKVMAKGLSTALGQSFGLTVDDYTAKLTDIFATVSKAVDIIGWIQIVVNMIHAATEIGPALKAALYVVRARIAIQKFTINASATDEQKSGYNHPDEHETNSLDEALSRPKADGTPSNALQSPAVRYLIDSNNNPNLSPGQVKSYMQSANLSLAGLATTPIGTFFPGLLSLNGGGRLLNVVNKIVNLPFGPLNFITSLAVKAWFQTPFGIANKWILGQGAKYVVPPMMKAFTSLIFKTADLPNLTGEDNGALNASGADIYGSESAQAIGDKADGKAAAAQLGAYMTEQRHEFDNRPLFARMFATDTPYSLASQLSIKIPFGLSSVVQSSFANLIQNPIGRIFGAFASLLHPNNVFAYPNVDQSTTDPLGVTQYATPLTDKVFHTDPNVYWNAGTATKTTGGDDETVGTNCQSQSAAGYPNYQKSRKLNTDNGQWDYTITEGCLKIQRAAQGICTTLAASVPPTASAAAAPGSDDSPPSSCAFTDPAVSSGGSGGGSVGSPASTLANATKPNFDTSCTGMPGNGPLTKINILLIHFTQDPNLGGCKLSQFFQGNGLGIQFNIDHSGKVYEYFPLNAMQKTGQAFAANDYSIGIEISAADVNDLLNNQPQFQSVVNTATFLCKQFNISCGDPKGDITQTFNIAQNQGMLGHSEVNLGPGATDHHCDPDCQVSGGAIVNWTDADRCNASKHPYMMKLRQAMGFNPTPGQNQQCPAGAIL